MMENLPAIVITYPFPLGGIEGGSRMTREIALAFGRLGIPVYLLPVSARLRSTFPRREKEKMLLEFNYDDLFSKNGVQIIRVKPHILHSYLDSLKVRESLTKLINEIPVAAVFSYFNEGIFLPSFLKSKNIPFVLFAIWQSYEVAMKLPSKLRKPREFLLALVKRQMIIKMYQQTERIFAISEHTKRELVTYLGLNADLINISYLGVAPEFANIPRKKPDKIKRMLFFGRIIQSKGIADAIQALKKLKAKGYHDWEYHIHGSGYPDWAKSLIVEAGLDNQIFVHKPSIGEALHQILASADILLMPSHAESFGLSFAEAQTAGLPVIGYAAGSVPEVVADGKTGWLAPKNNIDQITSLLIRAIENPEKTYQAGLAGRERAKQIFNWDKTAENILTNLPSFTKLHSQ